MNGLLVNSIENKDAVQAKTSGSVKRFGEMIMSIKQRILEKFNGLRRKVTSGRSDEGTQNRRSTDSSDGVAENPGRIKTRTIDSTYHSASDESYIGVASEKPITVYLPENPSNGKIIIVKAEMTPPLGHRKITISTSDGTKIDGYNDTIINVSHDYKCFIFNNNGWHII